MAFEQERLWLETLLLQVSPMRDITNMLLLISFTPNEQDLVLSYVTLPCIQQVLKKIQVLCSYNLRHQVRITVSHHHKPKSHIYIGWYFTNAFTHHSSFSPETAQAVQKTQNYWYKLPSSLILQKI